MLVIALAAVCPPAQRGGFTIFLAERQRRQVGQSRQFAAWMIPTTRIIRTAPATRRTSRSPTPTVHGADSGRGRHGRCNLLRQPRHHHHQGLSRRAAAQGPDAARRRADPAPQSCPGGQERRVEHYRRTAERTDRRRDVHPECRGVRSPHHQCGGECAGFTKVGSGGVYMRADNDYQGITNIVTGQLILDTGANVSAIDGDIEIESGVAGPGYVAELVVNVPHENRQYQPRLDQESGPAAGERLGARRPRHRERRVHLRRHARWVPRAGEPDNVGRDGRIRRGWHPPSG